MTAKEAMLAAHAEARQMVREKRIPYKEAMVYGLRRVHNRIKRDTMVKAIMAEPETPKFMWLRGWDRIW